jgi:phytoene desaturase
MNIGVIGSGIGGLAIAIRLARKGHFVHVFEKNSHAGGKISELQHNGYRFDTGPSLFTLPELVDELYNLCGENRSNYLKYKKLEIICKYFYNDGTQLLAYSNPDDFAQEIADKTNEKADSVRSYLHKAAELYSLTSDVFLFNSLGKLSNYCTKSYRKVALQFYKLDFLRSMHSANTKRFLDKKIIQLFDRYATYNGSNPYRAPATLNIIAHLEHNLGAYFPEHGMFSIAKSLELLAVRQNVIFHYSHLVEKIIVQSNKAVGLKVNGQILPFDAIISNSDSKFVANNLLDNHPQKQSLNSREQSSSALIFYWGINRTFPELELHNILFSGEYKQEFDSLSNKTVSNDPTVYIFISSKLVESDAPTGCENWFVMINVPPNIGQNWTEIIDKSRRMIQDKINRTFKISIENHIEFEHIGSPITIEEQTLSSGGALYGASSNSMFSAFLRHPNKLRGIEHLYFVGGSVHPGGGIPLCLASAAIVDSEFETNRI